MKKVTEEDATQDGASFVEATNLHNTSWNNNTQTNMNSSGSKEKVTTNYSLTPKASGRGQVGPSARNSLFGSVMKKVGQISNSNSHSKNQNHHQDSNTENQRNGNDTLLSTPSKQSRQSQLQENEGGDENSNSQAAILTTTPMSKKKKRWSAFTPERRTSVPFGSPGGFQLLDFVNNFASPFKGSNHSSAGAKSNMSSTSANNNEGNEWQNTSMDRGVRDWSLHESLRFDCHPGTMVNTFLMGPEQYSANALGMVKFLQPMHPPTLASAAAPVTNRDNKDGLAEWGAGLLYWQHPAVHPSPILRLKTTKSSSSFKLKSREQSEQRILPISSKSTTHHNKKRRTSTLDLAAAHHAKNKQDTAETISLQQQWVQFTRQRRQDWQQAFASLYWKWISQLRILSSSTSNEEEEQDAPILDKTYFYARGEDHVVLFQGIQHDWENNNSHKNNSIVPEIVISSSSMAFREALRQSGVEHLHLAKAWNGHKQGTVFLESMIQPAPAPIKKSKSLKKDVPDSSNTKEAATLKNGDENNNLLSPTSDSNMEEELAAIRRAQLFGARVGADVTVTLKSNKIAMGPKISLISVPPLSLSGWDDCAAFLEVYLNLGSSCCTRVLPTDSTNPSGVASREKDTKSDMKGNAKKIRKDQSTKWPRTLGWKLPDDVPLLLCRGVGPFLHATMKSLQVRGDPQYPTHRKGKSEATSSPQDSHDYASLDIHGGPILPCAVMELFRGLVLTMRADHQRNPPPAESSSSHAAEEEAMVGSHNLILRTFSSPTDKEDQEQRTSKHGIIGSSSSLMLNHFGRRGVDLDSSSAMADRIRSGHTLGMAVWDILHPHAMAYKEDPIEASASKLLLF